MLKLLKRAALLAVLLPVVASAQTNFYAGGGNVSFKLTSFDTFVPFQLYLEAVNGNPRRELVDKTGTSVSLNGGAFLPNNDPAVFNPFSLGTFAAGTALNLTWISGGYAYSYAGGLLPVGPFGGYWIEFRAGQTADEALPHTWFELAGVTSVDNPECSSNNHVQPCTTDSHRVAVADVTSTPEPASLALMATGLVGVIGFARRKRVS